MEAQSTEVQLVEVVAGVVVECKERLHQRMVLVCESFRCADHLHMEFSAEQAEEVLWCFEPSNFQVMWDLKRWAFQDWSCCAGVELEPCLSPIHNRVLMRS